ncbi:hypothetical protein ACIQ6Y_00715 [Streptomyces sp. NPDC096205]|uniref:hypothetical protein n=1 Tax=Streptomyces sp. NPDC096205 TaxID=3366081 RepID=UPI00380CCA25
MISTRRILAAACLAAGVTALAAPSAGAAETDAKAGSSLSPIALLDALATSDIPESHRGALPRPSQQLAQLNRVPSDLDQLHQITDLAAPVTGLLPGLQT